MNNNNQTINVGGNIGGNNNTLKNVNGQPPGTTNGISPKKEKTSIWKSGSFFIVLLLVIFIVIITTLKLLPITVFPFVIIGVILLYAVVGAFILRSNEQLSEKSFLELMRMSFTNIEYFFKKEDSEKSKKNSRKQKK